MNDVEFRHMMGRLDTLQATYERIIVKTRRRSFWLGWGVATATWWIVRLIAGVG